MTDSEPSKALGWLEASKSNAWTDLALTLPVFVGYHLGVVLLQVRNAADLVTAQLIDLAENNVLVYWGLTLGLGLGMVSLLWVLGRGEAFDKKRFVLVALEGVLYAFVMRAVAAYAVGSLPLGPSVDASTMTGLVMSMGAGFYEEVAFRVGLFGLGSLAIRAFFGGIFKLGATLTWAVIAAAVFAGWHYVGPLADAWSLKTFVFRWACGMVLTGIYVLRGFAPAVWTHVLYDVWAIVLHS